jgi:hypothetical protein
MAVEPSVPVRKLVIVEDSMLIGLSNNHQFVAAFPFLSPLTKLTKARAGGCGKCNSAAKRRIQLVNAAKMAIIGLDQSKKNQMKKLMNADKIQVKYRSGKEIKTHEF